MAGVRGEAWYSEGLRFECTQCGDCCTGAEGYVWVNQAEIDAMSARLGMDSKVFEAQFVRRIGVRRSLTERPGGDCVLLDPATRGCTVYNDRPRQCRTWPFWDSNLRVTSEPGTKPLRVAQAVTKATLCRSKKYKEQASKIRI